MKIIHACVRYPVTTMVGVILAVLFGVISLYRIPVQMTPTVDRPVITVETAYKGAAPLEVEEEVSNRLEEKLTSVEGLTQMTSSSEEDRSRVILEFDWGTNKDIARLDVSEKLGLVKDFPIDADRPSIQRPDPSVRIAVGADGTSMTDSRSSENRSKTTIPPSSRAA